MKTFKLTVNEDELKALIAYHSQVITNVIYSLNPSVETSARIHDLIKRLNRDTPDIEKEVDNKQNYSEENKNPEVANTSANVTSGW